MGIGEVRWPAGCVGWGGPLLLSAALLAGAVPDEVAGQTNEGWISVLQPVEWRGEQTRGIGVRRRNSIRVEGLAFQPGGADRIEIDGRPAQIRAEPAGEVRFVGYADTGDEPGEVEVVVYGSGVPPVSRVFAYEVAAGQEDQEPEDAWPRAFSGERYAVVIGISDYEDDGIGSLRYADDDAQAFYDFLVSERAGLGGFDPANVQLLLDEEADTRAVRTALTTFLRQVTEDDVVMIYLAGHGAPDPTRPSDYYLLTHDTEATNFAGTAVSMSDINAYVGALRARDVILFTDACHAAAVNSELVGFRSGTPNRINDLFLERLTTSAAGLLTFTASETNQYSQEGTQWGGGHGVFTYQLLRGLEGAADEDGDGVIGLGEILEFTRAEVRAATGGAQVPHIGAGSFDRSWPIAVTDPGRPAVVRPVGAAESVPGEDAAAALDLMSPAGTFAHSLVLPGSGQFRTGRSWRGVFVLGSAAGAAAYGYFSTSVTRVCREALVDGICVSGQFSTSQIERPHLVPALIAAGGITLLGAIDAFVGARSENDRRRSALTGEGDGVTVAWLRLSPTQSSQPSDLTLLSLRFR